MQADIILQLLQWAIPGGIGGCVTWIVSRQLRKTRVVKEVHDTYKEMYHDISAEIIQLRKENEEIIRKSERIAEESRALKRAADRLSRAIEAIQMCDYRAHCPVRDELQNSTPRSGRGQRGRLGTGAHPGGSKGHDRTAHRRLGVPAAHAGHDTEPAPGGGMGGQQGQHQPDGDEDAQRNTDHGCSSGTDDDDH